MAVRIAEAIKNSPIRRGIGFVLVAGPQRYNCVSDAFLTYILAG